ncbi:MAG: PAS domain-containing protein, partial [Cytophagaceae bacterium]
MFFRSSKSKKKKLLELQMQILMRDSQTALLEAATATANAAQDVTTTLRDRLDDSIRQFEHTASILNDALFLTEMSGTIQSCNPAAGRMFGRSDIVGLNIIDLFEKGGERFGEATDLWKLIETDSCWLPSAKPPHLKAIRPDGKTFWIEPKISRLDWSNKSSSMLLIVSNTEPLVGLAESS